MKTMIFTVCSSSHVAHAVSMLESVRELHADVTPVLGLMDRVSERLAPYLPAWLTVIEVGALNVCDLPWMLANYSVVELQTALKPHYFRHLFSQYAPDLLFYVDADVLFFHPLDVLFEEMSDCDILLTPHSLGPVPQNWYPRDLHFLNHGTYNLGFLGLRNGSAANAMLEWWAERLHRSCFVKYWQGMFTDQIWFNLVPVYFPVRVCRHPGANVAFWNLHERLVEGRAGAYTVNGVHPLLFYHYSGYRHTSPVRIAPPDYFNRTFEDLPGLRPIYECYQRALVRNGVEETMALGCAIRAPHADFDNLRAKADELGDLFAQARKATVRVSAALHTEGKQPGFNFLSEFAVTNAHGGGLTVQRVLQNDVYRLDRCVSVGQWGDAPPAGFLYDRSLSLYATIASLRFRRTGLDYWLLQAERMAAVITRRPFWMVTAARRRKMARMLESILDLGPASLLLVAPQGPLSVHVVNDLHARTGARYATWMMDDHMLKYQEGRGFQYPPEFEGQFARHLRRAERVFVISNAMGEFYAERFGVRTETLHAPADPVGPSILVRHGLGTVRLCYFGAIWTWQRDALHNLCESLGKLDAELDIYSRHALPSGGDDWASDRVHVRQPVEAAQVIHAIREYDAVVIPVSFTDESRPLADLNISTKLSECLASGVVTIIVGPRRCAMAQFVTQRDCGLVVESFDDASVARVHEAVRGTARERILRNARRVAIEETSIAVMHARWRKAVEGIIG